MSKKIYKLNKAVFRIINNPVQFLNGITSNTSDKPRNAFLNIHGRIVSVFDQVKISGNEYWIVVEQSQIDKLLAHIDRYIKLSQVKVQKLEHYVYFILEDQIHSAQNTVIVIPQKKGYMIITDQKIETNISDEEFTLFRLKNNIPLQGVDFNDDFILNIDEEEFVSYTKGCFLGQEPVSKVHNRSRPSWKLVVEYEDQCDEQARQKMTSKVLDPDTHRMLGFMLKRNE